MVCYGMVWYDMVWYGMVWYGMVMVWYGMVWYGMVWCGIVGICILFNGYICVSQQLAVGKALKSEQPMGAWTTEGMFCFPDNADKRFVNSRAAKLIHGEIRYMVWYGMVWYSIVWYGMVWYGMVWYGMVWWYGIVWYGS